LDGEPATQLEVHCLDVAPADDVEIFRERPAWWVEEPAVNRVRIGAPDQPQRRHVVSWNHARVARVKLIGPPVTRELRRDLIDALRDDERGSVNGFGEKIAHRAIEAARKSDAFARVCDERERALNLEHDTRVRREQSASRLSFAHGPESLRLRGNQVDDTRDGNLVRHARNLSARFLTGNTLHPRISCRRSRAGRLADHAVKLGTGFLPRNTLRVPRSALIAHLRRAPVAAFGGRRLVAAADEGSELI